MRESIENQVANDNNKNEVNSTKPMPTTLKVCRNLKNRCNAYAKPINLFAEEDTWNGGGADFESRRPSVEEHPARAHAASPRPLARTTEPNLISRLGGAY